MADRLTGFPTPTFDALLAQARANYAAGLETNPQLRRGVAPVMAVVDAQLAAGEYAYLDYIAAQTLALYATGENLDAWGRMFDVPRKAASRASGTATLTGNDGAPIAEGAALTFSDGTAYTVTGSATVVGGVATVALQADEGGAAGNRVAGEKLALVESVAGVDPEAVIVAMAGGEDVEEDGAAGVAEYYRGRVIERMRMPPHGGNAADYKKWITDTVGVPATRVWVYPKELGRGTVTVRFMVDGTTPKGIPTAEHVALAQANVDVECPCDGDAYVVAPIGDPLNIVVSGLKPDTPEIRTAIAAELADMLYRRASPGCTLSHSWIVEAIATAAGEDSHDDVTPAGNIVYGTGHIPVPGVVTYE